MTYTLASIIAIALVLVIGIVGSFQMRRRQPAPPSVVQLAGPPTQLDRADFVGGEMDWLVVVFASATCAACADVVSKAMVLESEAVAVQVVEFPRDRALHERYRIEQVPMVLIVDSSGVVRENFLGAVSATHLWAAVAEARAPGSVPKGCGSDHEQNGQEPS